MKFVAIASLSFLLAVGSAFADDAIPGLQSKQDFMAMKAKVNQDIGSDDHLKEMTAAEKQKVLATLDKMDARWQGASDTSGLTQQQRVDMANDQEEVSAILSHAKAESRMVCERIEPINSHLPKNVCKSVAARRRETEDTQDSMRLNGATTK